MTNEELLQTAWDAYIAVASDDRDDIGVQTPSCQDPFTAYDYARLMVDRLIRVIYPMADPALVFAIWGESGEMIAGKRLEIALANRYA